MDLFNNTLKEEAVDQLARIVSTTSAKIVLSSTWRRSEKSMSYLNEIFEKKGIHFLLLFSTVFYFWLFMELFLSIYFQVLGKSIL